MEQREIAVQIFVSLPKSLLPATFYTSLKGPLLWSIQNGLLNIAVEVYSPTNFYIVFKTVITILRVVLILVVDP
jgi:hypothetical protein